MLSGKRFGDRTLTRQTLPFAFDGGQTVDCRLLGGRTTDLNLMFRADRYRCAMQRLPITGTFGLQPAAGTRLILLIEGAVTVSDGAATLALSPFDALRDAGAVAVAQEISAADPSPAFVLTINDFA